MMKNKNLKMRKTKQKTKKVKMMKKQKNQRNMMKRSMKRYNVNFPLYTGRSHSWSTVLGVSQRNVRSASDAEGELQGEALLNQFSLLHHIVL